MPTNTLIGIVLLLTGITDGVLALVLPRRIAAEPQRRILSLALLVGASLLVGLGIVLLVGR
jgi:hypothetical protein